ncbi:MAG: carboxypeptidase regulatory-like domain-containing protein [Vicinamibacterales bacterium]
MALTSTLASAQSATPAGPPRDKPGPKTGTGIIRGRILGPDAMPLRRAQVQLQPMSGSDGGPRVTVTGDDGRYEFVQLPAGRYGLSASKGGFVDINYGQRRPFEQGRPIDLTTGQVMDRVDVTLPQGAVVTGRVTDETGEPVAQAYVQLSRYRFTTGKRRLEPLFGDSTDDRGEFRIFGVSPADYFLTASYSEAPNRSNDPVRYVRTFFPGTASVAEAQRVRVKLGEELSGVTLALIRQRAVSISGVVRSSTATPPGSTMVLAHRNDDNGDDWRMGQAGNDGVFSITGVLPGSYTLEAESHFGGDRASTQVAVTSADVAGVILTLSSGTTARGRVRFESGSPPRDLAPSQVFLFAVPAAGGAIGVDRQPPVVRSDWTFEITALHGPLMLTGGSFPDWHIKTVTVSGNDFTEQPIDFSRGDVEGIEVVLSNRQTEVAGRVTDGRGGVAGDSSVVIFAADPERWTIRSGKIAMARPDQQGRFSVKGLRAGRYLAIALDYLEQGQEHDPDLLTAWARVATSFTLGDGESRTVDLTVTQTN